jgi:hypothetical protein
MSQMGQNPTATRVPLRLLPPGADRLAALPGFQLVERWIAALLERETDSFQDDIMDFAALLKRLAERGWGRAPMEVNIEVTQKVDARYTREQLSKLTLEQLSALWREQIASEAKLVGQSRVTGG